MSTSTISRVTTTTSSAANKFSAAVSTPRKQIASAQVHMHPSPNSPFSLASMKPNLPRRAAITRLQTNGTVLALYMVVWALPRHYRTAKAVWTSLISWAVGLEWALWVNAALEGSLLLLLLYNTLEAAFCLRYPPPVTSGPKLPTSSSPAPMSPVALTAAQRRLRGSPKTPLPLSSSASSPYSRSTPLSPPSFGVSGFYGSRSNVAETGSLASSPVRFSQSFSSSLGGSTSSTGSYLNELGRKHSQSRALDTASLQRLVTELEFE